MVYEIRDYHYRKDGWDAYRDWGGEAERLLRSEFDIVDFWFDSDIPSEVTGSNPMDLTLGLANVTWIIRWRDMAHRESGWKALWENQEWVDHWERHPDRSGYLQMSVRFMSNA